MPKSAVINASAKAAKAATAPPAIANAAAAAPVAAAKSPSPRRTISRAAAEAGVHVETIRYYERLGLIPQPPRGSSYRHYPDSTVRTLRFVRQAQEFGFTLKEVAELIGLQQADASCAEICGRVDQKVAEIDRKIAALTALRAELSRLLKQSPRQGSHRNCKIYESLTAKSVSPGPTRSPDTPPPSQSQSPSSKAPVAASTPKSRASMAPTLPLPR